MSNINSWADTLTEFLKSSNEDERVFALFAEKIIPEIKKINTVPVLNWLEVGAGEGNKTKMFADAINHIKQFKQINLTICEPSIDWLTRLQGSNFVNQQPSAINVDFINLSIEQLASSNNQHHYNFISVVQVMYSDSIKKAVLKLIDDTPKGNSCVFWIDVEDKSGDFYKMRAELAKFKESEVLSMADNFLGNLTERGIQYKIFYTKDKTCLINKTDILSNDNHWLFPFIIGSSHSEYNALEIKEKTLVRNVVRNYITTLDTILLNIPDISILITLNKK